MKILIHKHSCLVDLYYDNYYYKNHAEKFLQDLIDNGDIFPDDDNIDSFSEGFGIDVHITYLDDQPPIGIMAYHLDSDEIDHGNDDYYIPLVVLDYDVLIN